MRAEGGLRTVGECKRATLDKPLISVVTIVYNGVAHLEQTINSVLAQTYDNIEYIIIDGGSTDGTLKIINNYENKIAYWVSEPDDGISDAFNKGVGLSTGEIIATLNADDYYADESAIQKVVQVFQERPEARVVYGKVRCMHPESGETLAIYYNEPFSLEKMKRKLIIPHPAAFMKRDVYETIGNYSLEYRICMDHEYLMKVVERYEPHALDEVLTVMRSGGVSVRNQYLGHREDYRILRSHGGSFIGSALSLVARYAMTSISFGMQRAGLTRQLLYYRKQRGQL